MVKRMRERALTNLPVATSDGRLVGLLLREDAERALAQLGRGLSGAVSGVEPQHLRRKAYVYVRQSTLAQVERNSESLERQYELAERAVALGWDAADVVVVDSDLGRAGRSAVSTTSAVSIATSVPAPIAMPTSAWARAGASLTPSPCSAARQRWPTGSEARRSCARTSR
jgi:hypothetical protein